MRSENEKTKSYIEERFFYPFQVSERDSEGKLQGTRRLEIIHGVGLVSSSPMHSRFFDGDDTSVETGDPVYEIRVRCDDGQWSDWQALVGEVQFAAVSGCDIEDLAAGKTTMCAGLLHNFEENFEIRKSGFLFKDFDAFAQIVESEDMGGLIKYVDPNSLAVKYYCQVDNLCYPLENQIQDMVKFRSKYHAYDENDNRI